MWGNFFAHSPLWSQEYTGAQKVWLFTIELHGQCLVGCLNVLKRVSMCPNLWINTLSAIWTNTWSNTRLEIWSNTNPNNFCSNWLSMQLADVTKVDFCSLQLLHCRNLQQLGQIRRFLQRLRKNIAAITPLEDLDMRPPHVICFQVSWIVLSLFLVDFFYRIYMFFSSPTNIKYSNQYVFKHIKVES